MKTLGIRFKLSSTLILAAAIPLIAGIISVRILGKNYYQEDKGALYRSIAENLSNSFSYHINMKVGEVRNWVAYSGLATQLISLQPQGAAGKTLKHMEKLDVEWNAPESIAHQVLANSLSKSLVDYQKLNPWFAELIVTDRFGGLVGASNMTSDYYQADEAWWQKASLAKPSQVWLEGIDLDESVDVYSLAISVPIYSQTGEKKFLGVLKVELDVSPLFASLSSVDALAYPVREVVLQGGRILCRFSDASLAPMTELVSAQFAEVLKMAGWGWSISPVMGGVESLVGFSKVHLEGEAVGEIEGLTPMYVVVRHELDAVMRPVVSHFLLYSVAGALLLIFVIISAVYIAEKKILQPIRVLRVASQKIASQAVGDHEPGAIPVHSLKEARAMLRQVEDIQTHDEIEALAGDFMIMAQRVLHYHEHMEHELALKSEEVEHDLVLAREFQEGLIPIQYPPFVWGKGRATKRLEFTHLYKPATSVGGDFFNIVPIDDHRIGVFMADVMGHGTRSALITSILRTLLDNACQKEHEPDELMASIASRFWRMLPEQEEIIFATACYVVIDLSRSMVSMACAGHPHPLIVDSTSAAVTEVDAAAVMGPALGLVESPTYGKKEISLQSGQSLFLYTDGVVEASNALDEEFGRSRLEQTLSRLATDDYRALPSGVMEELRAHMDTVIAADDICMVAVSMLDGRATLLTPDDSE